MADLTFGALLAQPHIDLYNQFMELCAERRHIKGINVPTNGHIQISYLVSYLTDVQPIIGLLSEPRSDPTRIELADLSTEQILGAPIQWRAFGPFDVPSPQEEKRILFEIIYTIVGHTGLLDSKFDSSTQAE